MNKITPMLWFDHQALEAAKFYVSVFKGGKLGKIARYAEGMPGPAGEIMVVEFKIMGQEFTALNGGPVFQFNEAISLVVHCKNQREVDYYWKKLTSGGGKTSQCGWLKDKYGVSWQVVPDPVINLLKGKDTAKGARVMQAIMGMTKIDVKACLKAASAKSAKET
jgi:predicted 3-demethylubiquinone-9 3-methyltransferase (glyoxalase superfamily)